jgi:hypothetical protein
MKKQHLFTLDLSVIQQLHRRIGRGHRSQFVETAIQNRLNNEESYDHTDLPTHTMAAQLMARLQEQNNWVHTPLTLLLKELIE